jgi:glycosyltransferase involved in cell wall biosynthesis
VRRLRAVSRPALLTDAVTDNTHWPTARARLSVLVPFLHDDPRPLLDVLDRQALADRQQVEVVVLDDGTGDDGLAEAVARSARDLSLPARFVRLEVNSGRGPARNRLAAEARSPHLLFLDADMEPVSTTFLHDYLKLVDEGDVAVAFGGFSVSGVVPTVDTALHHGLSAERECLPAAVRRRNPAAHVFTSNLLVRRDVFETEQFDKRFTGWGWEDVEWAARVAQRHDVVHVDNPATHLGLQADVVIVERTDASASNFALLARTHPELVSSMPAFRAASLLKRARFPGFARRVLRRLVLQRRLPQRVRVLLLRIYRAAVYARAL